MVLSDELSDSLQRFVIDRIDSVEQVNILSLFCEDTSRAWTVAQITQQLRSTESSVQKRLNDLYERGILKRHDQHDHHSFTPCSDEFCQLIKELLSAYRSRQTRVIELIYSKPPDALRAFADAFRIKKDKS